MRKIIILVLILAATSAHAGWKMYAPGQKDPIVSSVDDPNAPPKPHVEVIEQPSSTYSTGQARQVEPGDNFDQTGIEWRTSRGYYSGRNSEDTRRYGYRAGTYLIEYKYRGGSNFIVWMHTRRGLKELPINVIGSKKGSRTVQLKADDEVFFEVTTTGNWEMTMEKMR